MSRQRGLVVVAMITVVSASGCGKWQGQAGPHVPRVKLLRSELASQAMPAPLSWCTGNEFESAAARFGDGTVYVRIERAASDPGALSVVVTVGARPSGATTGSAPATIEGRRCAVGVETRM
jgi:hypothetical protein